jgi:hypothetical protein
MMEGNSMRKIRVLLAAHIGEPRGGVSTYYEAILNSDLKEYISDGCHSSLNTLADTVEGCIEKLYTECERLIKEEKLAVYE